ncbi:unnamed protein product [Nezara viridula]|uniref:U1-type domain-containing protein n=1 Tax=Nezara viridula TaxID=85310 RepID=A0A9P0E5E5_NEZVI|nr:unnamed protein product [Nezara viridula]
MDHRRKWNRDEYESRAAARLSNITDLTNEEEKEYVSLDFARPREYKINFESFRSRKEIIDTATHKSFLSGGFHCSVCDIIVKNDILYLDHLNGRRHQKHLGRSLKTRRASVQEVRYKLRSKKKELEESKYTNDLETPKPDIEEEEQKVTDMEVFKKAKKVRVNEEEKDNELPSELQQVMGFSSFVYNQKK